MREATPPSRRLPWWLWALPALLASGVVLSPGMRGEFVWDDDLLILDHPHYRRPELILSSLRSLFIISPNYFRPFAYLSLFVDYTLFGPRPLWYHLENLLLHWVCTLMVARLVASAGASAWGIAAAAALFALHPSRVEGVVFVSSRFDLLATTWFLAALLWHRAARGIPWLGAAAFALALGSKEMAVSLPVVAWLCDRTLWQRPRPPSAYLPYALVLALFLGMRVAVLGRFLVPTPTQLPLAHDLDRVLLVGKTVWGYLAFILVPLAPCPVHLLGGPLLQDPQAWAGIGLLLLGAWACLAGVGGRVVRRTLLLLAATMAPVMNLVPIQLAGPSFMAERFLYLPMAALALAVPALPWHRRGMRALAAGVLAVWGVVDYQASGRWVSDRTLFSWVARACPQSALGFTNLALEETRHGSPMLAVALAESALARDRSNPDAWDNLGVAYFQLGMLAQAESSFAQALRLAPHHPLFASNLAGTWRAMGRCDKALALLKEVIARTPTASSAYLNMGLCYLQEGDPQAAIEPLATAARLMEVDPSAWLSLAEALILVDRTREAHDALAKARSLGASDLGAQVASWGRQALRERRVRDAAQLLRVAGSLSPEDASVANDLGVALRAIGATAQAESCFARATSLDPALFVAWANLGEVMLLRENTEQAESILISTIRRWPEYPDAYRHLARVKVAQGQADSARALYRQYQRLAPHGVFAAEAQAFLSSQNRSRH